MDVWLMAANGCVSRLSVPWCACIHVSAENRLLDNLSEWLQLPEISSKFSVGSTRMVKKRLSLDEFENAQCWKSMF